MHLVALWVVVSRLAIGLAWASGWGLNGIVQRN